MKMKDIIIDNCHIGYWDDFDCPDESILCFEGLVSNPCRVLVNKYKIKSEVEYMIFLLPHISKLFKIDRNKLRDQWIDCVGYYKCFGEAK